MYLMYINDIKKNIFIFSVLFFLIGICIYSYVNIPLAEDQKIFLASARIADRSTALFPFNVYSSWELKPIGNRIVVYLMYKFSSCISNFNLTHQFEKTLKSLYAFIICLITFILAYSVALRLKNINKTQFILFLWFTFLLGFFTLTSESAFQTEEFAVLIQLASFPLVLSKRKWLNICSGIPLAFTVCIKGITIMLPMAIFIFSFLLNKSDRSNVMRAVISFTICLSLMVIFIVKFMPREIIDFYNTALFSNPFPKVHNILFKRLKSFIWVFKEMIYYIPIIFLSLIAIFLLVFSKKISFKLIANILLLYFLCGVYVMLQGKFYEYHFLPFLFPAFISFALLFSITEKFSITNKNDVIKLFILFAFMTGIILNKLISINNIDKHVFLICIFLLLFNVTFYIIYFVYNKGITVKEFFLFSIGCTLILWLSFGSRWGIYTRNEMALSKQEQSSCAEIKKRFNLNKEKSILYLDDGVFTYYIDVPSANRYFFPIPLKRAQSNSFSPIRKTEVFISTFNDILAYKGQYVVASSWLNINAYPKLAKKISTEYEIVYQNLSLRRDLTVYKRRN